MPKYEADPDQPGLIRYNGNPFVTTMGKVSAEDVAARLNREEASKWRDIASAPMDETAILLWPYYPITMGGGAPPEVVTGFWSAADDLFFVENTDQDFVPSHWQPLPEGP